MSGQWDDAVTFRLDRDALSKLLDGPDGPVAKDLERRALKVETFAKDLCPVDTGRLRSSITHAVNKDGDGLYADIGTNVEYALPVESRTSYLFAALSRAGET